VEAPHYAWNHGSQVVSGEGCPTGSSSAAGIAFGPTNGSNYPSEYRGALFFADYSRNCIWAMLPGADGVPDPARIRTFAAGAAGPVHLQIGPSGDLFYVDFGGTIRRVTFTSANQPPTAVASATPTSGNAPLTVNFNGAGSSDPDPGDPLTYSWDLDGDGQYGDSTAVAPTYTYTNQGVYTASLRVTDNHDAASTASVQIEVGNTAPSATIVSPAAGTTWKVGDVINFAGSATDAQDGPLPASALSWDLILHHCSSPSDCHPHPLQSYDGVAGGSFTAPDHEYPSHLELQLTATDSGGLTDTKTFRLDPRTVTLTFSSTPGGLRLAVNGTAGTASFTRTVIVGSKNTVSAITPQNKGKKTYVFSSWSDGGAQTHSIIAPATNTTYTARFR
jgi:PKD repeat protein